MDFKLNDDQELLRSIVERFVAERFDPSERPKHRVPDAGFQAENWALLSELGLLALPFAEVQRQEDQGDLDGSPVNLMIVMEAMGRGVVAEPYLADILISGQLLARAGTQAQKERWIDAIGAGSAHVALAHLESHSFLALDQVSARVVAGQLTGTKTFVFGGTATDAFIVSARDEAHRVGLFLVESTSASITRRPYRLIDGSTALEISFANTPAAPMAGGLDELLSLIDLLRLPIAAEMLGLMSMLFEVTLNHLRTRKQFGVPIGSFQAIQHRMADHYLALEQSRSLVLRAAMTTGIGAQAARLAAKAYIGKAGVRLGEDSIQLHGGIGVTDEIIVGHAHKRLLLLTHLFGDADAELARYLQARQ